MAKTATYGATKDELEQWDERGFFIREGVFTVSELEAFRAGVEHVHEQILAARDASSASEIEQVDVQKFQTVLGSYVKWEWEDELQAIRSMEPTGHLDARLEHMIDDPRLWQPVQSLSGCKTLSVFSDKLNEKRPGGSPFPFHQEGPYWGFGAEKLETIVSAATYFDDGNKENGCLWVIPGSHRAGNLQCLKDRGVLGRLYTDVDLIDGEAFAVEATAGSVLFFHTDLVHGSQMNRSQTSRRVFVIAYQEGGLHRWRLDQKREVDMTRLIPTPPPRVG